MNKTTIIVPVYSDRNTLRLCIESLKKYISNDNYVIFVNDCGPECDMLESEIISSINGLSNFSYYRNDHNLGFVKTCNYAVALAKPSTDILLLNSDTQVTEGFLEEMQYVLYADERHGAVCPRSNNATLLTIPVKTCHDCCLSPDTSYSVYQQVHNLLPRWTLLPTGVGFALLIKRDMIERFGLFDDVYSPGYNEENDFCMRIGQYGYNVAMANHAYVFHFESKSFGSRRSKLDAEHYAILAKRYPYYSGMVNNYYSSGIEPVDYFADLIADGVYPKKRILFSLYELPATHNGTAKYSLSIYEAFLRLYGDKYDIHLLTSRAADKFHNLSESFNNIWYPDTITGQTFHIAYSPSQIHHIEHLLLLNRTCLKYSFCMQDIISLRSPYLMVQNPERVDVLRLSIHFCNLMTSISKFSLKDTMDYYNDEFSSDKIPVKVIYHGADKRHTTDTDAHFSLPYSNYFVVFGNNFKHKLIPELLDALKNTTHNIIVIGSSLTGSISNNIYGYKSGTLSEEFIDYTVDKSMGIIFPSTYEGFGLPFLDSMSYRKKLVVNNTELNRELNNYFNAFSENVYFFNSMTEIDSILSTIAADPLIHADDNLYIRSWNDSAKELEECLAEILDVHIDTALLKKRWQLCNYISSMQSVSSGRNGRSKPARSIELEGFLQGLINRFPRLYGIYKKIRNTVRH